MMLVASLFMANLVNAAEPTVDDFSTDPSSPTPKSTITVTATFTGDDISSVTVKIQECSSADGVCFINNDYEMSQNQDGDWVATATLKDDSNRADYISYIFYVTDSGVEYELQNSSWKLLMDAEDGNGGNGGDGNSDGNGTPGFEVISLLLAVLVGVSLLKRKRSR